MPLNHPSTFVLLPMLIPLATAIGCLAAWRFARVQRAISVCGAAALFIASIALIWRVWIDGFVVTQVGDWPAPFGITLVADLFSAAMVLVTGIIGLVIVVYSYGTIDRRRKAYGYHALVHTLLLGVCGSFLTGDLFNLYVWFEVMVMSSFVLLSLGGERSQLEGSIKYVTLNLLSSVIFLSAVGILYGAVGTLNMADLAVKIPQLDEGGRITIVAMLFLIAFGIKAAMFPLFFWLPASYHTPPPAVSALFSALLTKVGVYAMVRLFTLIFTQAPQTTHTIILVLAGLTMLTGVLGAVAQNEMRRLLSFHIVSQIGYPLMALGLFTKAALAAGVYFMVHVIMAKAALFLVSGMVYRLRGTYDLNALGGLYASRPLLALLFFIPAMSLAGLPPLSGFFGKYALIVAGLRAEEWLIVGVALVTSLLTLLSMVKVWTQVFWKPAPNEGVADAPTGRHWRLLVGSTAALGLLSIILGVGVGPIFAYADRAGSQLMNPQQYIEAVLSGTTATP